MVPPGLSLPSRSAASTILTAIRSLTEPPGLRYSILARTSGLAPSFTRDSWSSGVLPTSSINDSTYCTLADSSHQSAAALSHRGAQVCREGSAVLGWSAPVRASSIAKGRSSNGRAPAHPPDPSAPWPDRSAGWPRLGWSGPNARLADRQRPLHQRPRPRRIPQIAAAPLPDCSAGWPRADRPGRGLSRRSLVPVPAAPVLHSVGRGPADRCRPDPTDGACRSPSRKPFPSRTSRPRRGAAEPPIGASLTDCRTRR